MDPQGPGRAPSVPEPGLQICSWRSTALASEPGCLNNAVPLCWLQTVAASEINMGQSHTEPACSATSTDTETLGFGYQPLSEGIPIRAESKAQEAPSRTFSGAKGDRGGLFLQPLLSLHKYQFLDILRRK